jgi:REP-associated tyrosine transposase
MRLFEDEEDAQRYLAALETVVKKMGWRLLGYCLMVNHVHLVIETPEANLGRGMGWLHTDFAMYFNRKYNRCGHVFQGRFGSKIVKDDQHLWTLVGYVALNPVRAGLCERPEQWDWSSHRALLAGRAPRWLDAKRLFSFYSFNGNPAEGARNYALQIEALRALRCPGSSSNLLLGSPGFG